MNTEGTTEDKKLESRARQTARCAGLRAEKSRTRKHFHSNDHGGWAVIDDDRQHILAGEDYDMTAQAVIEFCEEKIKQNPSWYPASEIRARVRTAILSHVNVHEWNTLQLIEAEEKRDVLTMVRELGARANQ
jgi:hypothetical protein